MIIQVDPTLLQGSARQIQGIGGHISSSIQNLAGIAYGAPSYEGQFGPRVAEVANEVTTRGGSLAVSLDNLGERLGLKGLEFANADNAALSGFSNIGRGMLVWLRSIFFPDGYPSWLESLRRYLSLGSLGNRTGLALNSLIATIIGEGRIWNGQTFINIGLPSWWPSWFGASGEFAKPNLPSTITPWSSEPKDAKDSTGKIQSTSLISRKLGTLSEKYESNGNPGAISSGVGDPGGVSYGTYQLTTGNVQRFLNSTEGSRWASEFHGLVPGSKEFSAKWMEIAQREGDAFGDAQHAYIKSTHYEPMVKNLETTIGLDATHRSATLQDVIWSTSVQHGPASNVIQNALAGKDISRMTDKEIIISIYSERGKADSNGILVYFSHNSLTVQKSVANRLKKELQEALDMLDIE